MSRQDNTKETIKQGVIGGVLGACIGIPGIGVVLGVANANKNKIKSYVKKL